MFSPIEYPILLPKRYIVTNRFDVVSVEDVLAEVCLTAKAPQSSRYIVQ